MFPPTIQNMSNPRRASTEWMRWWVMEVDFLFVAGGVSVAAVARGVAMMGVVGGAIE